MPFFSGVPGETSKKYFKSDGAFLLLGCVLIMLTRLPQLWGSLFFPDGDECAVGLMVKHFLEWKDFSLFLYGVPYGFSVFETLPAALFFKLFGPSAAALKSAILCLWAVGWIFFVLFLRRLGNQRVAVIGGLLLIFSPGWGAISLKAWGTHVTAFTFTNLSIWILAGIYLSTEDCKKNALFLGCCLAVAGLANPLWFSAMVPFIALLLFERKKTSDLVFMILGVIGLTSLILFVQQAGVGISTYWSPPVFADWNILEAIRLLPGRIWVAITGTYFTSRKLAAGPETIVATALWIISSLFALGYFAVRLMGRKHPDFLTRGLVGTVLFILVTSLFFNNRLFGFRYLLPLIGSLAALVAVVIDRLLSEGTIAKFSARIILILLIFTGMMSLMEFRHVPSSGWPIQPGTSETKAIADLTGRLSSQNIHYVYSIDSMLQWQVMFASEEHIKARWLHPLDRYPEYPLAVDRAFASNEKVAIICRVQQLKPLGTALVRREHYFSRAEDIDGLFMIIYDPSRDLLEKMGFVLNQY
jgi:hypothetical protein